MRKLLFILPLLIVQIYVQAQSYTHIGVKQGLSNRKVYCIQEDDKGYMWFLTNEGIDRYNGKEIKTYTLHDGPEEVKSLYNMNWLLKDSKGTLWEIGRKGRVYQYDKRTDRFNLHYKIPATRNKRQYMTLVSSCSMDDQDRIWLCRDTSDIYIYDTRKDSVLHTRNIFGKVITTIIQRKANQFYIGTERGIYDVVMRDNRLVIVKNQTLTNIKGQVNKLYYNPETRNLYIGTFRKGLYVYEEANDRIIRPQQNIDDSNITQIVPFNSHEILIATDGSGVYRMDAHTYQLSSYISAQYNKNNSMTGNCIIDLFIDDENRIWMANYPYGVSVRHNKYSDQRWIRHSVGNTQSLVNDNVNAILEDRDGDLWFATNNGISLYRPDSRTWKSFMASFEEHMPNNKIFLTLCEVEPGIIWCGGYSSGIFQIDKRNGTVETVKLEKYGLNDYKSDKYLRTILQTADGKVWVGGYYNLKCIDLKGKNVRQYPGLNMITCMIEKGPEEMWIGTANGLYILDTRNGEYSQLVLPVESSYINTLYQDKQGELYVGTDGSGLLVYIPQEKQFTKFNTANSTLISNSIYTILAQEEGNLLLSTENGISSYQPHTQEFTNWTKEQGLKVEHFNPSSGIIRTNQSFLFGGTDGAVEFSKNIMIPSQYTTRMVFSDFQLFYQTVYPGEKGSPLVKDIDETDMLVLKHSQNIFSLKVSSINFDYPSNILYSWRLKGFFDEWSKPDYENTIRFTNLNPGKYTLQVRAVSNENLNKTLEMREITILVEKPVWATYWAIAGYCGILLLFLYGIIRVIVLNKQKQESNDKINFFINTAHDIRTPLTLIKAPLEELTETEHLSETGMANANTALRNVNILLNMTGNLLNFEQVHSHAAELKLHQFELNAYMSDLCGIFHTYASQKSITLSYHSDVESCYVWFDKDKMDSIVKNLLSNALKYTEEQGKVEMIVSGNARTWSLEVKDNGIGIPEKEQKNLFRLHVRGSNAINAKITGSGIGLMLVWKLVHQHHGKIELHSRLNQGSSFKITFPKEDKKLEPYKIYNNQTDENLLVKTESTGGPLYQTGPNGKAEENRQKLLVVEDNDELRNYLRNTLSDTYTIQTANNGKEALQIIGSYEPDLIISDIMMPEMRGDELCHIIKNHIETSHIPIILLTALDDEKQMLTSLENGADEFAVKPFKTSVLKAKIANLLANRQRLKQKYANLEIPDTPKEDVPCTNCTNDLDVEFIARIKKHVEENMEKPSFNVDSVCAYMNMSRTSFYNKVKALTDQAPADYIRFIKLKRASELLKTGQYSITEIAEMTGFNDAKYFREVFKKYFHVSPSKYIKGDN